MKFKIIFFLLFALAYLIFLFYPYSDVSGDIFYDSEEKLWAHRVLDVNQIEDLSNEFNGFEVDVFYNSNKNIFDVKHHGNESDISLDEYFKACKDLSLKFWIDFKNLNENNTNSSILLLNTLAKKHDLKSDIIIESKEIELLSKFKEEGFYTSYWLPNYHLLNSFFNINQIKKNILDFKPHVISMPYSSVKFYSRKFPNYPIHCWTNGMIKDNDKDKIKKLSENNNVKIILTDFKTNFLK